MPWSRANDPAVKVFTGSQGDAYIRLGNKMVLAFPSEPGGGRLFGVGVLDGKSGGNLKQANKTQITRIDYWNAQSPAIPRGLAFHYHIYQDPNHHLIWHP